MGNDLDTCFYEIKRDVRWLNIKFMEFTELYGNTETIELLDNTAHHFFGTLRTILLEDIILHLSRLTDPKQTSGKQNLSIDKLFSLIQDVSIKTELDPYFECAKKDSEKCRKYRNQKIAHNDYKTADSRDINLIKSDITDSISSISEFIKQVSIKMNKTDLHFNNPLFAGAKELITNLKRIPNYNEDEI